MRLSDFRKFMACLVGRDPKSELAMLKVDSADRPNEYLVLERPDRP